VVIPSENVKDLAEIPDNIKGKLNIEPVRWIDEVFKHALERVPEPVPASAEAAQPAVPATPEAPRPH
jgi:ATP-dependent Lon protease